MDEPTAWLSVAGFSVPVWIWRGAYSPDRMVIASHGLTNDHHDAPLFDQLRREFIRDGKTMLIEFDYPGSGRADGGLADKRFSVLRATLEEVAAHSRTEQPGVPLSVVGRSVGGTIALSAYPQIRPSRVAVMSPPYELVAGLGPLRGEVAADGLYPLPPWAAPSGQVKGSLSLPSQFYDELEPEELRLRRSVGVVENALLISSTEDPKIPAAEMDVLWKALSRNSSNSRQVFAADHNYTSAQAAVVQALTAWIYL